MADQIYNAIFIGSIYALFALGFTLVFSVLDILNLAHPALFTLGAFTALFAMQQGVPAALAVVVAFVVCGIAGVALDRVAFAPLRARGAPPLSAMISSIGVALIITRLIQFAYGPDFQSYPAGSLPAAVYSLAGVELDTLRSVIIACAIGLMLALTYLVRRTRLGRELRALAENPRAARLLGIDVDRAIAATFFLSAGLGGVAGVLYGFATNSPFSQMGLAFELKAFAVMIVGGMGSIPGAVLGAYLLAFGEIASLAVLPSELRDAFAYGLLFIVLLVRPAGVLGRRPPDRV
ncbi:MAG TPA: branched-chain amino acid ABC transporter permease [Candidatus Limnocylindria bacterium]|nr:branched-chain amino acid ABC transporter permease [Candidatus Limnocylindria bacterium]